MKLLLVGTSLRPAYGGPAYSVSRLALALAKVGLQVGLWAPDRSATTTELLPLNCSIHRLSGSESEALETFGKPDVLHDNGIWLRHNHRLARLAAARRIPRVVSTRGMLEPWAMNHKRFKKGVAWALYQRADLMCACCHHTTAQAEAASVQTLKLRVPIRVIPNGVDLPEISSEAKVKKDIGGKRKALFLGRIHPKKGLLMLVEAWARVRPKGWLLDIVGPDEGGHRVDVEKAARAARLADVISFVEPIDSQAKKSAFLAADLFVLPTHSENFGMAIAEALAHGLPVLTTTGAPWPMLRQRGCGVWVDPTIEGITEALRQTTSLDSVTLHEMGRKGREFVAAEFGWDRIATQFVGMYEDVIRDR